MLSRFVIAAALVSMFAGAASAGQFEDDVRARWRGAWVLLSVESWSTCNGGYFNNDVSGTFVTSRGGRKFEPGELAKVQRVQIKKKKAELLVQIAHTVLASRQEGPFTLYDTKRCAIELEVAVDRDTIKAKDVEQIDRLLGQVATRFSTESAARDSAAWNGREGDALPDDYEQTLAQHSVWKAEQTNLTIDAKLAAALDEAEGLATRVDDDDVYLAGFAAGSRAMTAWSERSCGKLVSGDFSTFRRPLPKERKDDQLWSEGFQDGQRLVYDIFVMSRLPDCYVDVPDLPVASLTDGAPLR